MIDRKGAAERTLQLACELIRRRSVTPDDAGCQTLIAERLAASGFTIKRLPFGEVENLLAIHGSGEPSVMFLGHTDVVPPGPLQDWHDDPFEPNCRDGRLYGRGAADMKGGVAAAVVAMEQFVQKHPDHAGSLMLLLTSDEEGPAQDGIRRVAPWLQENGHVPAYCVVGEPSSIEQLGDLIRVGRRGSLHGRLRVHGIQGHVAYPEKARNPIHVVAQALADLAAERWDEGMDEFPPTSFQISNIHAGDGTDNVIPGRLEALFNFRFCPASSPDALQQRVESILTRHGVEFGIDWRLSGEPFLTRQGALRDACVASIYAATGRHPTADTGGGTSDGRFMAPLGSEVVELGLINASIHQVNENTDLQDLALLPSIYADVFARLLTGHPPVTHPGVQP